jgi:hypothetical protein
MEPISHTASRLQLSEIPSPCQLVPDKLQATFGFLEHGFPEPVLSECRFQLGRRQSAAHRIASSKLRRIAKKRISLRASGLTAKPARLRDSVTRSAAPPRKKAR